MRKIILPNEMIGWKLSGAEFKLYALLTSFGEKPFELSIRSMSLLSGLSQATVKRTICLLEGRRLLIHATRIHNHRRTVNRYKVLKRANRRHFFCLPAEAIGSLTPNELLVYAYLICRAGRTGKPIRPSGRSPKSSISRGQPFESAPPDSNRTAGSEGRCGSTKKAGKPRLIARSPTI